MKFRKKPVVIEAMQFNKNDGSGYEILNWANNLIYADDPKAPWIGWVNDRIRIPTLEGVMDATPGDWIIRGRKGEFYPCKPDIFEATYDPVPAT
jgi:hypothetical protein